MKNWSFGLNTQFFFKKFDQNTFLTLISLRTPSFKSSAISKRNEFISYKTNLKIRLLNFFNFNGNLLSTSIFFSTFFSVFLKTTCDLKTFGPTVDLYRTVLSKNPDFIRLYNSSLSLRDFDRCYLTRCGHLAPNVKAISVVKKQKKQKKNKKLKKYSVEYRLIKPATRLQTLNRWLASIIRVHSSSLESAFATHIPAVLVDPNNSKLFIFRQRIYTGLANR